MAQTRNSGSEAYEQGYALGTWIGAFLVTGGLACAVWFGIRRMDHQAALEIDNGLAEKLAAAPPGDGTQEREAVIREAEAWADDATSRLLARRCANASLAYTALTLPLGMVAKNQDAQGRLAQSVATCVLVLGAIGLAIFALSRIPRYGRKGLLLPACLTLGFNALLIGAAVWQLVDA